jgi:molybdenum cofactor guanylyltransferase
MGADKALLPFRGGALGGHIAALVAAAAGSVTLIGDPGKYGCLGYPVLPDRVPGRGPAGGIHTALHHTTAEWNLVTACDMPALSVDFLRRLLAAAEGGDADALLPAGPSGQLEPLCAVYHRRCAGALARALDAGVRKVTDTLAGLRLATFHVLDAACFQNLNTPEEWHAAG